MENSTSGNRVHHCRHPWCSRRSNDDVKDEHESLELHEFFSVLRLFVRFVRFVFKKNSFLLVASIFGLDYYVKLITRKINGKHSNQ
jgi:hypothetical protein